MSHRDFNDPRLVTSPPAPPSPKGEPVAKPPQTAPEALCYPSDVMVSEVVREPSDVVVGDFLRSQHWSRVRRVECIDQGADGPVLLLREPDDSRTNAHGIRRLDQDGWRARGQWIRYPNLRRLWDAAHDDA